MFGSVAVLLSSVWLSRLRNFFFHLQQTVKRGDETHEFCAFPPTMFHLSFCVAMTHVLTRSIICMDHVCVLHPACPYSSR